MNEDLKISIDRMFNFKVNNVQDNNMIVINKASRIMLSRVRIVDISRIVEQKEEKSAPLVEDNIKRFCNFEML